MSQDPRDILFDTFRQKAGGDPLVLDRPTLGDEALADFLSDLLDGFVIGVGGAHRAASKDDLGNVILSGELSIGRLSRLPAKLLFFTSRVSLRPTVQQLEVLITFDEVVKSLTLDQFGPQRGAGDGVVDPDPVTRRRDSFYRGFVVNGATVAISSFDFAARRSMARDTPPLLSCSVPDDDDERALLVSGINVEADGVGLEGAFFDDFLQTGATGGLWDELRSIATGTFQLRGAVRLDVDTGDRLVELTHDVSENRASIATGIDGIEVTVTAVTLRGGLDPDASAAPTFALTGTISESASAGAAGLTMRIDLPLGAGSASVTGLFGEDGLEIGALDRLIGAAVSQSGPGDAKGLIPEEISELGVSIKRFSATTSLPPGSGSALVEIGAGSPWKIVPGLIEVDPSLLIAAGFGAEAAPADVVISANLKIGSGEHAARLELFADPITGIVGAMLAPGQAVTAQGVAESFGLHLPESMAAIALIDLEVEGNYQTGDFSFAIECASTHDIDIFGDRPLPLTDLRFTGDYFHGADAANPVVEWRLEALFALGSSTADVVLELGEKTEFDAFFAQVEVGEILADILHGIELPEGLERFVLGEASFRYSPDQLTFQAGASSIVELVDGFGFSIIDLTVTRRRVAGEVKAELSVIIGLELGEDSDEPAIILEGKHIEDGVWTFAGSAAPDYTLSLEMLADRLLQMVGLHFPLPLSGLSLTDLACSLTLGPNTSWSISCGVAAERDGGLHPYGKFAFVARREAGKWAHLLILEVEPEIGLSELPVVGPRLPNPSLTVEAVRIILPSGPLKLAAVQKLLDAMPPGDAAQSLKPAAADTDGDGALSVIVSGADLPAIEAPLKLGGPPLSPVPAKTAGDTGPAVPAAPPAPLTAGTTKWHPVGKRLGPVELDRIGMQFEAGKLTILADARMMLGPVTIGFMGLGLRSPVDSFSPEGVLDGLSVDYSSGPVSVGGGLVRRGNGYEGQLHLTTATLSLEIIGGYSPDPESFFAFGMLRDPPLGGPPHFFVEGVAVGMGYNSRLDTPASVDGVAAFPLVQAAMPAQASPFGGGDLASVASGLGPVAHAMTGAGWLAAGVKFNSFKLIDSFALIAIDFGRSTRVTVMGLSRATLPPETEDPVALFEVALLAVLDPDHGTLKVDGALTSRSYALSRSAHLTGGFAFHTWFKDAEGAKAGDFVYTMGGYHPRFAPPPHYPVPQRLALNWQVSDDLSVKGSEYFAMTPACLMAGVSLEALWSSGDLSAWFDADADFLLYWKPFHYLAHVDTSIGVSYRLNLLFTHVTITVHIGVSIDIQGPPFGGEAHIDLDVVSFTISFGDDSDEAQPLSWSQFRASFLPADPASVSSVQPVQGLLRDRAKAEDGKARFLMRPDDMRLAILLSAPAKTLRIGSSGEVRQGSSSGNAAWNDRASVAPMRLSADAFISDVTIELRREGRLDLDEDPLKWGEYGGIGVTPQLRAMPASLWSEAGDVRPGDPNAPALVHDLLGGLEIVPLPHDTVHTALVDLGLLRYMEERTQPLDFGPPATGGYAVPPAARDVLSYALPDGTSGKCENFMLQTITAAHERREVILGALRIAELLPQDLGAEAVRVEGFASTPLEAWPLVRQLGEA